MEIQLLNIPNCQLIKLHYNKDKDATAQFRVNKIIVNIPISEIEVPNLHYAFSFWDDKELQTNINSLEFDLIKYLINSNKASDLRALQYILQTISEPNILVNAVTMAQYFRENYPSLV